MNVPRIDLTAYKRQGYTKEPRYVDPRFLAYTRVCLCTVRSCTGSVKRDADHQVPKGQGNLASDLLTLPFCNPHHMELTHNLGRELFEQKYNLNLEYELVKHIERYLQYLYSLGSVPEASVFEPPRAKVPRRKTKPVARPETASAVKVEHSSKSQQNRARKPLTVTRGWKG